MTEIDVALAIGSALIVAAGLLRARWASGRRSRRATTRLPGTGRGYFVEVVGESFYQEEIRAIWASIKPAREFDAKLIPEPQNPHDKNAVAVQTMSGATLGYLPRAIAPQYQQLLLSSCEAGVPTTVAARLVGGTGHKRFFGVQLDLVPPTILASRLGLKYKRVRKPKVGTRAPSAPGE